jgi:hypothetical protein
MRYTGNIRHYYLGYSPKRGRLHIIHRRKKIGFKKIDLFSEFFQGFKEKALFQQDR